MGVGGRCHLLWIFHRDTLDCEGLVRYAMNQYGADLADVQGQAGERRQTREVFLLGAWRKQK